MSDLDFAIQIRRLLLSIAHLIKRRYGTDLFVVILTGERRQV